MAYNRFTSKQDGMGRAKRTHACLDCRYNQPAIWKVCPACGSKRRQMFGSRAELQRGMTLMLMQEAGEVSNLRFQPRYDLIVKGVKVGVYTADCEYVWNGQKITEDTKPPNFIDKYAALKMALFQVLYETTIKIPQRKSGNMT